jgi:glycosyltransferase involved in cell wall biosynthesis
MIIYISDSLNSKQNGGSSTSGFEFFQYLRIYYNDVVLISSDHIDSEELGSTFYNHNLKQIYSINILKRNKTILNWSIRSLIRPIYYFFKDIGKKRSVDLNKYYTDGGINIIYVNSWSSIYNSKAIKNGSNFIKVCIVRGAPESFIYQSFERDKNEAIRNAAKYLELFDKLIYVSLNGLNAWKKILKINIDSYYLPNSINEEEIKMVSAIAAEDAAKILGFDKNSYNIVIVGSIQKRKAQEILLNVITSFLKIKPNLKIHFVGVISKTWGGDKIYNLISQSEYSSKFIFHGHSDDALLYMRAANLLIFTSYAEAFPRTVAEYMALGKPILAADVSGVNEMIEDGKNGYLYDPLDPTSLVNAFSKIENSETTKILLSKNAYDTYWNKFSKNIHISKSLEVFNKIGNG